MQEQFSAPIVLGTALPAGTILLLAILGFYDVPDRKLGLPRIGPDPGFLGLKRAYAKEVFKTRGNELLHEAYRKARSDSPDTNYVVQTEDMPRIILAPKFLPEVVMLPESTVSHRESINLRHIGPYTGLDIVLQSHLHSDICRVHLRRNLPQLLPGMAKEVDIALNEFLGKVNTEGFTPLPAMGFSFFTIARIFSLVFVGDPLCRDKQWMQALGEYPKTFVALAAALRPWSSWLRPFVAPLLREKHELRAYQDKLLVLFGPTFAERRGDRDHLDALQWLINSAAPHEADDRSILLKLMFLSIAAVHTSAASVDHVILDLCSHPKYISTLRAEITEALEATGGRWTLETISKLPKLDSFLQESRRWNHPASLAVHRRAMKSVTLSDGTHIPKGWVISTFAEMLSHDVKYFDKPDVFDGDRFLSQDTKPGENNFARILDGNLSWGQGRSTCPGRWYADAQIKLVTAKLIREYDFRLPGGTTVRPTNLFVDERIMPDPKVVVEFRKLQGY